MIWKEICLSFLAFLTIVNFCFVSSLSIVSPTSSPTTGLKCYECRIDGDIGDKGCENSPPPEDYLKDCLETPPECFVQYIHNGTRHTVRACRKRQTTYKMNACFSVMTADKSGQLNAGFQCQCGTKDGCNSKSPENSTLSVNATGRTNTVSISVG